MPVVVGIAPADHDADLPNKVRSILLRNDLSSYPDNLQGREDCTHDSHLVSNYAID